jgi:hypothetical protein
MTGLVGTLESLVVGTRKWHRGCGGGMAGASCGGVSPRTIKETFLAPADFRYPFLLPGP